MMTEYPQPEIRRTAVYNCSACGKTHEQQEFGRLPGYHIIGGELYDWWSRCPQTGDVIYMREEDGILKNRWPANGEPHLPSVTQTTLSEIAGKRYAELLDQDHVPPPTPPSNYELWTDKDGRSDWRRKASHDEGAEQ